MGILVQTEKQWTAALSALMEARVIAVDTETTGLHFHQGDRIIGISTYCLMPGDSQYALCFYFPFRHEPKSMDLFTLSDNLPVAKMADMRGAFCRKDVTLIFHNAKFDLKMLRQDGLEINPKTVGKLYDTMVMGQMVDENARHTLDGAASYYFKDPQIQEYKKAMKKLVNRLGGWEKTSPAEMCAYACKDAELTYRLCEVLGNSLVTQDLMHLWDRDERFIHCLKEMEWEGIEVDFTFAEQQALRARSRMRELEDELGFDPLKLDRLAHRLYGDPPEGLGLPMGERSETVTPEFPSGRPVMDEEVLQRFEHPVADSVLEYRGLVKANSTWWTGYQQKAGPDRRIHPTYNSREGKEKYGTVTSRLSSSDPNIQQMPRDKDTPVKKMLMPPEGHAMVEFDYSQAELRLATVYADDETYRAAFLAGVDAHQATADEAGIDRQAAKHAGFTVLYGGAAPTLKATIERLMWQEKKVRLDFPLEQAEDILARYYEIHPNLKKLARAAEATAKKQGYVRLWNGRRRHFDPFEPWTYRKAFNSIIQGGIAQLVQDTMLKFHDLRGVAPWRMVLQVHDSLWFEVPMDGYDEHCTEIIKIMEWPSEHFGLPFKADMKLMRTRDEILVA